ncbi:GtrA family protein [Thermoclostridium caenicola]|uniref:Flippase GtrA (Transmembrane translocase of bactoprenol-linked glucose) n=1 Tax=Thermoclostridium caenicola TaxID=659425 RepID=A0A1M6GXP9_9FIRM|nr:GtrA family protein [Thermoclostridium caenicola]SHJ14701.1 Putative flippase GtrA (transmembrane translocase of bactoprenol-linked glucose) [Thermoclostridium caenicola]HPU21894.1 GtrA family protein [Thermoclostridium caenicola]
MTIKERLLQSKLLKDFMNPETLGQFIRYFIVGIVGFALEYALFIVLRDILHLYELLSNIMVYTVIFWFNFLLNKFFSFRSRNNFKRQLFYYGILFVFNLVVGNVLLFSGIRYLLVLGFGEGSWPVLYLPKILIMFFIVSWNFVLYKKVIYK